jgi:hypothetical protein
VNEDCCAGLACDIAPGATSGTCSSGTGPVCADSGQSCLTLSCCSTNDTCEAGICTPPPVCAETNQLCTSGGGECCPGLECSGLDRFENEVACGDPAQASASCYCAEPAICPVLGEQCSAVVPCCEGYCGQNVTGVSCTSTNTADCSCKPVG